jgi:hypothetical protein
MRQERSRFQSSPNGLSGALDIGLCSKLAGCTVCFFRSPLTYTFLIPLPSSDAPRATSRDGDPRHSFAMPTCARVHTACAPNPGPCSSWAAACSVDSARRWHAREAAKNNIAIAGLTGGGGGRGRRFAERSSVAAQNGMASPVLTRAAKRTTEQKTSHA